MREPREADDPKVGERQRQIEEQRDAQKAACRVAIDERRCEIAEIESFRLEQ